MIAANNGYNKVRAISESSAFSYSLGLNFHKMLSSKWSLMSGMHTFKYVFESAYSHSSKTDSNYTVLLSDTFTNTIAYFEFPFIVERKFVFNRFDIGLRFGPKINIVQSAFLALPHSNLQSFRSMDKSELKKMGIGFSASIPFYFYLNNSLHFEIEPNFQLGHQVFKSTDPTNFMHLFSAGMMFRVFSFL